MQPKNTRPYLCFLLLIVTGFFTQAQEKKYIRCATTEVLEAAFIKNPGLKAKLQKADRNLLDAVRRRSAQATFRENAIPVNIPVVFHIVLTNPNVVTDASIQAQLDTLNKDYAGLNGDSIRIPPYFKPLFGKSGIRFVMAQRTPDEEPTNGIIRYTAGKSSFSVYDTSLKYTATGGADAWDPDRYLNIWVCNLSDGILGYGTFPGSTTPLQQGVAILFSSLPGGTAAPYNKGRTLTHEAGHYFNLYHIWGDDGSACTGTDQVDDTPNQGGATGGCPDGDTLKDNCSPVFPGILFQDYMDYTDDACMHLFTGQQVTRMETALNLYRATLLTSNGATPVVLKNLDASLRGIQQVPQRVCTPTISPTVTLRNRGQQTLTSVTIYAVLDGGNPVATNWTGSLASLSEATAAVNSIAISEGRHTLKLYVANPNGGADMQTSNDTLTLSFEYYAPVAPPLTESFEGSTFPPTGWDIINPDRSYTWEKVTGIAKTGNASIVIRNLAYQTNDQKDYIRLPEINITNADSAFMTFQVAAAVQTDPATTGNVWDTLQVLVSKDCGKTYTSLYKKWNKTLITHSKAVTSSFIPLTTEWRKDSVDLTAYINAGPVMLAFLNTTEYENNIYLDDINVNTQLINVNLKAQGFMVTPNPAQHIINVQFYPRPATLKGIFIYNSSGSRVAQRLIKAGSASTNYQFDLSSCSDGVYIVQAVFSDKKITKKIIKGR
jgi:hypothetical protein